MQGHSELTALWVLAQGWDLCPWSIRVGRDGMGWDGTACSSLSSAVSILLVNPGADLSKRSPVAGCCSPPVLQGW